MQHLQIYIDLMKIGVNGANINSILNTAKQTNQKCGFNIDSSRRKYILPQVLYIIQFLEYIIHYKPRGQNPKMHLFVSWNKPTFRDRFFIVLLLLLLLRLWLFKYIQNILISIDKKLLNVSSYVNESISDRIMYNSSLYLERCGIAAVIFFKWIEIQLTLYYSLSSMCSSLRSCKPLETTFTNQAYLYESTLFIQKNLDCFHFLFLVYFVTFKYKCQG